MASIWRLQLTGLLGRFAWLTVHIYDLIGFRNRAVVLISWAWNYLCKERPIRMITDIERDTLADKLTASGTAATPGPQPADAGDTTSIASGS